MARWYDKHELLSQNIERLKDMEKTYRDFLLTGIMILIREHAPSLLDDFVLAFPLNIFRRRWYDKDPYLWLIINGLSYADDKLLDLVAEFLEGEYQKQL